MLELSQRIETLFSGKSVKPILDKLNITQATYYRSIKTHNWKLEHVVNIAEHFGVTLDWLILGKENNLQGYIHTINTLKETIRVILDDKKFSDTNTAEPAHTSKGVVSL